MKTHRTVLIIAGTLALGALPAFANTDHDAKAKIKMLDTNGDGRLSRAEFVAGKEEQLRKLDANNDGVVTPGETSTSAPTEKQHFWNHTDKTKTDKINMADANGDGKVTADEAAAYADKLFTQLDTNNDGYLTVAELEAAHK